MNIYLNTVTPQFTNDILDIVRVFFGAVLLVQEESASDLRILHTEKETLEGVYFTLSLSPPYACAQTQKYTPVQDPLLDKRYKKRAIKLMLYTLLQNATHKSPPWGAVTGIRPTRLLYMEMAEGKSLEEAGEHVKNTFFMQEEKLDLLKEVVTFQSTLPPVQKHSVDIYVGIPFCVSRCAYCSFLSGEIGDGKEVAPYLKALLYEIACVKKLLKEKNLAVSSVYVGGGTPTSIDQEVLSVLLTALAPLAQNVEFTVEAGRPDTITEGKLLAIKNSGATRISINPQTMHDQTLQLVHRLHTKKQTEDAFALARKIGFTNINMDLIAGLPNENESMFFQTLEWIKQFDPESLTVHSLALKHSSTLSQTHFTLPDGQMVSKMLSLGEQYAHQMGMKAYYLYRQKYMAGNLENVGYAKKDCACLYNVHMMEEISSVLALGAGGISKRILNNQGKIKRAPNVSDVKTYIERIDDMIDRKRELFEHV